VQIPFRHNPTHTLGVELELCIVDRGSGALVDAATELLDELGAGHPGGEHPKAKHELFECTVEVITGVCTTPAEAHDDLLDTLREVADAAGRRGLGLMSAGTHPFGRPADRAISPNPRYAALVEEMQWAARRLLIFGTHVHVGVRSGEKAIVVVNELQRHLPVLLALAASSPYLEDEDTGMASVRSKVFEALPTAGLPPTLAGWADFEAFMGTLIEARCISSIREVWWDIRPHPDFGTVELRMCDAAPTVREVTAIAALAQALVAWIDDLDDRGELGPPPREWTVRENRWLAGRHGLDAELIVDEAGARRPVRDLVAELVETLTPVAVRLGSEAELRDVLALAGLTSDDAPVGSGPGYLRQRQVVAGGGGPAEVVHALVRELDEELQAR
jgi:carboxylate-amine ligase